MGKLHRAAHPNLRRLAEKEKHRRIDLAQRIATNDSISELNEPLKVQQFVC
jgi:hypothetical protein